MIPHIVNGNGTISLLIDGKMKPIDTAHPNYDKIKEALKEQNWDIIPELVKVEDTVKEAVKKSGATKVEIKDGNVFYDGMVIHNTLTKRMLQMLEDGFDITYLIRFLENLMQNPSHRAVMELYDFLEAGSIPITENGTFLTYKKIREDWKDIYTGTIDNSIGQVIKMPRNMVDEDSERTCSQGLHVCSYDYLPHFGASSGDRVVICEVNPKDVVAIPKDYNNTKMRVCEYKVVGEVEDVSDDILGKTIVYEIGENDEPDSASCTSEDDYEEAKKLGKLLTDELVNMPEEIHLVDMYDCLLNKFMDTLDVTKTESHPLTKELAFFGDPDRIGKKVFKAIIKGDMSLVDARTIISDCLGEIYISSTLKKK